MNINIVIVEPWSNLYLAMVIKEIIMKRNAQLLALVLLLFSSSCSSVQILTDYDKKVDFSKFQTFEIAPLQDELPDDPAVNQLNLNRVLNAIRHELTARGYDEASPADLAVNIYVRIESFPQTTTVYDGPYFPYYGRFGLYRHRGYYSYWGLNWTYSDVQVRNYKEGTLVVDLVDVRNNRLVWHGVATGTLSEFKRNPEEKINKALERMFKEYPYRVGSNIPIATSD